MPLHTKEYRIAIIGSVFPLKAGCSEKPINLMQKSWNFDVQISQIASKELVGIILRD